KPCMAAAKAIFEKIYKVEPLTETVYYTLDGSEPTNSVVVNPSVIGPIASGDLLSHVCAASQPIEMRN
ncbi:MAG: hypothetical protein RIR83_1550, partial [Pseudomonadota bacterium]